MIKKRLCLLFITTILVATACTNNRIGQGLLSLNCIQNIEKEDACSLDRILKELHIQEQVPEEAVKFTAEKLRIIEGVSYNQTIVLDQESRFSSVIYATKIDDLLVAAKSLETLYAKAISLYGEAVDTEGKSARIVDCIDDLSQKRAFSTERGYFDTWNIIENTRLEIRTLCKTDQVIINIVYYFATDVTGGNNNVKN